MSHANHCSGSYTGDFELVAKLEDELKHEKASGLQDLEASVQNIQYVLQNNSWEVSAACSVSILYSVDLATNIRNQVKDVPGEQEVVLSKKLGNEE